MASKLPSETIFDEISQQISDTFNELLKQLTARRDQLLAEVNARKAEFQQRLKSQEENIGNLEKIRIQIEQMSTKQNLASNLVQTSLAPIQKQISDLKNELVGPHNLKFECPVKEITTTIKYLGEFIHGAIAAIDYSSKVKATHVFRDEELGSGQCNSIRTFYVDGTDLYVFDRSKIQIFNTNNWSLKHKIDINYKNVVLKAVATDKNHCYLTGSDMSRYWLYKLNKTNFQVIKSENRIPRDYSKGEPQSVGFISLAIIEDEIFISTERINKIYVFDLNLCYRRQFGITNIPKCIQVKGDRLYVLDIEYSLHILNTSGEKIGSSHEFFKPDNKQESEQPLPAHAMASFCFDPTGNAVLVVPGKGRVVVVSPGGEKIYELGEGSQCNEDIGSNIAVAVFQDKIIIACPNWGFIKVF